MRTSIIHPVALLAVLAPLLGPVPLPANAQGLRRPGDDARGGRIEGSVTAVVDSAPIRGATVLVIETAQRAISDSLGRFTLAGVAPGRYQVEARQIGKTAVRR